jgi:hypothetical protein
MTTWNPSDKQFEVGLSGGDLIATYTASGSGSSGGKVRADTKGVVGKYFEITANVIMSSPAGPTACTAVGLAALSSNLGIGNDPTNSVMLFSDGWVVGPGGTFNTGQTWSPSPPNNIVGVEYQASGNIRFHVKGKPVVDVAPPSGVDLYPAAWLQWNGDQLTANFGATTFDNLPSGATAWGVSGSSLPPISASAAQTLGNMVVIGAIDGGGGPPPPPVFGTGGYFPDTIAAILAGRQVRCDFLVFLDFTTTPMRVWLGHGTLHTNDGNDWQGLGQLARIGDLESSIGGSAPQATFSLSGVDPDIIAAALAAQDEIFNRNVDVLIQFFDNDNFQPLDNPYVVWAGIMDTVRIRQSGPDSCVVEMSAETIFARRALAPLGNLTDREQQQFFPGDTGLAGIPSLMSKVAIWPVILPGFP